jgi:putative NADH-flavin reductase
MTLAILGATGRTGRSLVKAALEAGHSVRALVRNMPSLDTQNPHIEPVQGDATDPASVDAVVQGADGVLCVIGHARDAPKDLLTKAARNLVNSMQKHGVQRLIYLTGAGVRFPEDQPRMPDRFIRAGLKLFAPALLDDSILAVDVIRNSALDWTIVRGPMLTQDPGSHQYRADWVGGNVGTKAARETVAQFMLDELHAGTWVHKAPVVSD